LLDKCATDVEEVQSHILNDGFHLPSAKNETSAEFPNARQHLARIGCYGISRPVAEPAREPTQTCIWLTESLSGETKCRQLSGANDNAFRLQPEFATTSCQ